MAIHPGHSRDCAHCFSFSPVSGQAYDELDFDQSTLRAIYEASTPKICGSALRQSVQAAGRTDYLTILAGVDFRSRAETRSTLAKRSSMIRILAENREYERLWSLAPELALPYSLKSSRSWRRTNGSQSRSRPACFWELVEVSRQPILLNGPELIRSLPLAHSRAQRLKSAAG